MNERFFEERRRSSYDYPSDGVIRRQLHEFGAQDRKFYSEVMGLMGFQNDDTVLDVGAGMGTDGMTIARTYHPKEVYLLEPQSSDPEEFENKFFHLNYEIQQEGLTDIVFLPVATGPMPHEDKAAEETRPGNITYIQPLVGVAEAIPLPDESVNKVTMIHSAYHFDNLQQAFKEAARVLVPGGTGVLITNGPDDKLVFKEFLQNTAEKLKQEPPPTVSSKLTYDEAYTELSHYFKDLYLHEYQDKMVITEDRLPNYLYAFNSYRFRFARPVINIGRWARVRKAVVEDPIQAEMAANGVFRDTIDIAAIYFRDPK